MSMVSKQAFHQPQSGSQKGMCLRLSVKWAVTRLCGGTFTAFMTDEEWLKAKSTKDASGGSKGYKQYKADLDEAFGDMQEMLLKSKPTIGVEHSRWKSTIAKQAEYAHAIEAAESKQGDVHTVDLAFIQSWASKVAHRHGRTVAVKQLKLDSVDGWLGIALATGALPAKATFVIGCDFANANFGGGHAIAYSDPVLFDPNGGLFESDMEAVAFRFTDLDAYIRKTYGKSEGVVCYVLTLG